jgi:hypothetical protein
VSWDAAIAVAGRQAYRAVLSMQSMQRSTHKQAYTCIHPRKPAPRTCMSRIELAGLSSTMKAYSTPGLSAAARTMRRRLSFSWNLQAGEEGGGRV